MKSLASRRIVLLKTLVVRGIDWVNENVIVSGDVYCTKCAKDADSEIKEKRNILTGQQGLGYCNHSMRAAGNVS